MKPNHRRRNILLTLTALIGAVWLASTTVASPERWRANIEQVAGNAIGKPLHISGPLRWHLGQGPGLRAERVVLANPDWAKNKAFATIGELEVELSWADLLRGKVVIAGLELEDVQLHLERNDEGKGNWTFNTRVGSSDSGSGFNARIDLRGLAVSYRDAASDIGRDYRFPSLHLSGGAGQAVQLDTKVTNTTGTFDVALQSTTLTNIIADPKHWPLSGSISRGDDSIGGSVTLDLARERPLLNGKLDLHWAKADQATSSTDADKQSTSQEVNGPEPSLETILPLLRRIDTDLALKVDTADWSLPLDLTLKNGLARLHSAEHQLTLTLDANASPPALDGILDSGPLDLARISNLLGLPESALVSAQHAKAQLSTSGLTMKALLDNLRGQITLKDVGLLPGSDLHPAILQITRDDRVLTVDASGTWGDLPFTARQTSSSPLAQLLDKDKPYPIGIQTSIGDNHMELNGLLERGSGPQTLSGKIKLNGTDPSQLNNAFNAGFPKDLHYKIDMGVEFGTQKALLSDIRARLNKITLRGKLALDHGAPETRISGQLRLPRLDLSGGGAGKVTNTLLPTLPASITADIELRIDQFSGIDLDVANLNTQVKLEAGTLTLDPLKLSLSGLASTGSASYANTDAGIDGQLKLNIPRLNREFAVGRGPGMHRLQLHTAPGSVTLASAGRDTDQWLKNLRMDGRLDGLSLALNNQSGITLNTIKLDRVRLSKRSGKDLLLNADGNVGGTPMKIKGHATPGRGGKPSQVTLDLSAADLEIGLETRLPTDGTAADFKLRLRAQQTKSLPVLLHGPLTQRGPYRVDLTASRKGAHYSIDNLDIRAGENDLKGRVDIDVGSNPRKLSAILHSHRLQPTVSPQQRQTRTSTDQHLIPDIGLIPQVPAGWDADYRIAVDELVLSNNTFFKFLLNGTLRQDHLFVDTLTATMANRGTLSAKVDARIIDERLHAHLSARTHNLDLGWILTKPGDRGRIPWLTTVELDIKGQGKRLREFLGGANGAIRFVGGPMALDTSALDLWTLDLLTIALPDLLKQRKDQGLQCSVAGFSIDNGLMTSKGMLFDTSKAVILGSGSINLRNETLDLLLSPKKKRLSLFSIATPVSLKGTLMHPKPKVPPEQMALTAGSLALKVVQPWVLAGGLVTSGYRVENPCLKTFEDMSGKHPGRKTRASSPFGQALKGIESGATKTFQEFGGFLD